MSSLNGRLNRLEKHVPARQVWQRRRIVVPGPDGEPGDPWVLGPEPTPGAPRLTIPDRDTRWDHLDVDKGDT